MRGLASAVLLAALTLPPPAGAGPVRKVRDMMGRTVAVPARAARIVSLAPAMTEIVYALGAGDRLAGVTEVCDFPQEATRKPRIGGIYTPNLEAILSLRPDLVLASSEGNREEDVRALERLGVPVYVVRPLDFATVLVAIERVGELLGEADPAARLSGAMRARAAAITRAVAGAPRPRVLYVLWGDPVIVAGRDTLITDLIRRAGGDSVTGEEPLPYPRLSMEALVVRAPERIVLARHGLRSVDDRLREWRHLGLLAAVRAGRVQEVDGDLVHRAGPRVIEGLARLAALLHPDRWPGRTP